MMLNGALPLRVAAALLGLALVLAGCAAGPLPAVHSDAERLELARRQYRERDWVNAIDLLKTYIDRNAGSADVDEAIYLLGECYLESKDYPNAALEFERLQRDYPESDSSGSAAFSLGEALFGQSRPADFDQEYTMRALEQWERFRRDYPGHWLEAESDRRIAQCRARLASKLISNGELYLKLRLADPARVYFRRVVDEFADTPEVGDAMIGIARCDARLGRTTEAVEYLKELEARFGGQPLGGIAARERAKIERMGKVRPPRQTHLVPESP
jgi:outer membrane protein assembly factor BamD